MSSLLMDPVVSSQSAKATPLQSPDTKRFNDVVDSRGRFLSKNLSPGTRETYEGDLQHIHNMWSKLKEENIKLREKSKGLERTVRNLKHKTNVTVNSASEYSSQLRNSRMRTQQSTTENEELKTINRKLREENDRWANECENLRQDLDDEVQRRMAMERNALGQQEDLAESVRQTKDLEAEKKIMYDNALKETRRYRLNLQESQLELQRIKNELDTTRQKYKDMYEDSIMKGRTINALEEKIENAGRDVERLTKERNAMKHQMKTHSEILTSEATLKVLNEHLKHDNARLVRLLTSTKEYKDMQNYWDDSQGATYVPGGKGKGKKVTKRKGKTSGLKPDIAFMRDLIGPSGAWGDVKVFQEVYKDELAKDGSNVLPNNWAAEKKNWIPTDALQLCTDLRLRHLPTLKTEHIAEFLRQLNEVWHIRENRRCIRLKKRLKKKVEDLERQAKFQQPYVAVIQQNKIKALHREINELRNLLASDGLGSGFAAIAAQNAAAMTQSKSAHRQINLLENALDRVTKENNDLKQSLRNSRTLSPTYKKHHRQHQKKLTAAVQDTMDKVARSTADIKEMAVDLRDKVIDNDIDVDRRFETFTMQIDLIEEQMLDRMKNLFNQYLEFNYQEEQEVLGATDSLVHLGGR
eukprot:g2306.t1